MLKVFLVEDEIVVREGIKNRIDWAEEGFLFVGEASDGELAYPMIQKLRPDILITDIKMPFMDGLSLSRLIKSEMPSVRILVLSGYDEFAYAKEAINIGVADYLVKPISGEALLKAVKRVASEIQEERRQNEYLEMYRRERLENEHLERQRFFYELISFKGELVEILEKSKRLKLDLAAPTYKILLYKTYLTKETDTEYSESLVRIADRIEQYVSGLANVVMFDLSSDGWAFLLKGQPDAPLSGFASDFMDALGSIVRSVPSAAFFGGLGVEVNRIQSLSRSYETASRAFAYRYFAPENQVMDYQKLDSYTLFRDETLSIDSKVIRKLDRKILENFLKSGFRGEVSQFLDEYFHSVGENNLASMLIRQYVVMDLLFSCITFVEGLGKTSEKIELCRSDFGKIAANFSSLESTKTFFREIFEETIQLRDEVSTGKNVALIRKAIRVLQENFQDSDISLNTVAASVNLSPSHFSTVFSQEVGKTFIEYLTELRMDKAKELLKCSDMKSSEIAYAIGYKDPHYFSYLFKKMNSLTPKEYRMKEI